jgi:hypothetical protein
MTGKIVSPSDHPDKDIRSWIKPLCDKGWTLRTEGHGYRLYCSCGCTTIHIGSTPSKKRLKSRIKTYGQRCPLPLDDPRRSLTGMDRA